ncbi:2753_t:CDS:1 [Ambispora gerdemannii]|uniref:2753_t:CDS:1 n=1 Tax=Ambispora gerdemannii TaxID=144530 RepID=A0A9N9B8A9_9GLOM|nr:2753_t:CDS:1 [Ambispora gerdemannii]
MSTTTNIRLPIDILSAIFDELAFDSDKQTLFICLFLNRECCRIVVPILWRNPFDLLWRKFIPKISLETRYEEIRTTFLAFYNEQQRGVEEIPHNPGLQIIDDTRLLLWTYLSCLSQEQRLKGNFPKLVYLKNTIFNYITFLNEINVHKLYACICLASCGCNSQYTCINCHRKRSDALLAGILDHVSNPKTINITSTRLQFTAHINLSSLSNRCRNIRQLSLDVPYWSEKDKHLSKTYAKEIATLIRHQSNLETFTLDRTIFGFEDILAALETCSTSLLKIAFVTCDVSSFHLLLAKWNFLEKLEKLSFIDCFGFYEYDFRFLKEKMVNTYGHTYIGRSKISQIQSNPI